MKAPQQQTFRLPRGADRMLRVSAGSELFVSRGVLQIVEACRLAGDHLVNGSTRLEDCAQHRIEAAGWIMVTALSDCEWQLSTRSTIASTELRLAWRRMMTALRRSRVAARP